MQIESLLRTKSSRLVTIRMDDTVLSAARRLRGENIGLLVVKDTCATEGDTILGVVSERDVLQAIVDGGAAALGRPVRSLMTTGVVCCQLHDSTDRALTLMHEHHVRHLPVLHDGLPIGVVSIRDLIPIHVTAAAERVAA